MAANAQEIIERMQILESERSNFSSLWQECADYGMPGNNQITRTGNEGQTRPDTYQTVGENCIIELAAGLYSYMFPTDSKAFTLKMNDDEVNEIDSVKQWLQNTTDKLHIHLIQSNFRQAFFENLKSMVLFGMSCLYCEPGTLQILNFINFHMAGIYVDVDNKWNVDTVLRKYEFTAKQAVQEFGKDKVGEKILEAYKDPKKDKKFTFIHALYPRKTGETDGKNIDPLTMDFASVHVCKDDKNIVSESGYPEFPLQVPRFDRDALEKYGRSPMMKELPDIKMLSDMKMVRIKAWEKMCDPPIVTPDDGSIWPLSTSPGAVLHKTPGGESPFWFEFKGDVNKLNEAVDQTTKDIKDGFFLGLFEMPEIPRPQMTATEIIQRAEQKMRILTPIIGRLQSELFNPLIHRMVALLIRSEALPPMPREIEGREYQVEYLGHLALVLKTIQNQGFVKSMEELNMSFGQMQRTEYMDNINIDKASRDLMRNNGVPATWLKNEDERDDERQQLMQAIQNQQAMEQLPGMAKAAADAGKAPEKGSITERMLRGNAA